MSASAKPPQPKERTRPLPSQAQQCRSPLKQLNPLLLLLQVWMRLCLT